MKPITKAGKVMVDWFTRFYHPDSAYEPKDFEADIVAIEKEAIKPLHLDPKDNERCDGRCAADECVCPEGGWAEEADRTRIKYQLLLTASKQCAGSPKHFGGCGCLCHGDMGRND